MGREEHVEIRVVGSAGGQLHDQQRAVNGQGQQNNCRQWYRSPKETRFRDQRRNPPL